MLFSAFQAEEYAWSPTNVPPLAKIIFAFLIKSVFPYINIFKRGKTMDNAQQAVLKLSEVLTDIETAVISNPAKRSQPLKKVKIEKIRLNNKAAYQFQRYTENKVTHENLEWGCVVSEIISIMQLEGFKQCSISGNFNLTLLMNKDRQFKITGLKQNVNYSVFSEKGHNRRKKYILGEKAVPWMISLGIMDENGNVTSGMQKKFRQINRFIEMLADVETHIPDKCTVIDMGCGKSYLTFAMYHYLNEIKGKNVKIQGYDLKADVVAHCNELVERFGFSGLEFFNRDIAEIENTSGDIAMIITLHACDTATDIAMYHGIRWGCKVIMSVPCCQHELFGQIKNDDMCAIMQHGILKERFAALLTDGIRAQILEIMGYKTNVMEFIDMEHTPKNIMIRAVKTGKKFNADKKAALDKQLEMFSADQCLYRLCFENANSDTALNE